MREPGLSGRRERERRQANTEDAETERRHRDMGEKDTRKTYEGKVGGEEERGEREERK